MIILDFNQISYSCIAMEMMRHSDGEFDSNMVRHFVLNSIRSYNKKYSGEYGQLVIACDGKYSWRRKYFPNYKASRRKNQEDKKDHWENVYETINELRSSLKTSFPFKVIHIDGVEADDIIGRLTYNTSNKIDDVLGIGSSKVEPVLIVSGDKDFKQLLQYKNVKQFSPTKKVFLKEKDPILFLHEHILLGDSADGIPNMFSSDECLISENEQQARMTSQIKKTWNEYINKIPEFFEDFRSGKILQSSKGKISADTLLKNYDRNKILIDLKQTPEDLKISIDEEFKKPILGNLNDVRKYMIQNRLKNLMENLSDFKSV